MKKSIAIALAFAVGGLFAGNEASKVPMIVYRGELFDAGTGKPPAGGPNMTRAMWFSFYDTGASGAESLCSCELKSVPINPDGSFEAILGPDGLPGLVVSGLVTHVGLRIGTTPQLGGDVRDYAEELSPRRELRPLVGVNRALVAEAGTSDMCIGVLAADALAAGRLVVNDADRVPRLRWELPSGKRVVLNLTAQTLNFGDGLIVPPAEAAVREGTRWIDASTLTIEGRAFPDGKGPFDRLPASAEGRVTPAVWYFSHHTAGMALRFRTDSDFVKVKWDLLEDALDAPNMSR